MAMLERTFNGNFNHVLDRLHDAVMEGSMSVSYENGTEYTTGDVQCAVRMYERYSFLGGNRVALCMTLTGRGSHLHLTAITAGGSQAVFFKLNTMGEESFLDTLARAVDQL